MKSSKEFFDRLATDWVFREDVFDGVEAMGDLGAADPVSALTELTSEMGYDVSAEIAAVFFRNPEAFFRKPESGLARVSDSDLEAVAGGYQFLARDSGLDNDLIVDDKTGEILWEGHIESPLDGRRKTYALGVSDLCIDWAYYNYLREPYRHPTTSES